MIKWCLTVKIARRQDMNEIDWLNVALSFLGGFGLFLFGMEYMGEGLQKAAGSKMKNLLGALTSNPFLGVLVGAAVTALIQSSSATTVMVVGFVNAGLMSLKQAVGVIMGANIGTTVTAWIVSLGEWTSFLKPSVLAPICIIIGVIMISFCKKQQVKHIGQILFGFGGLFLGLDMMGDAAEPLAQLDAMKNLFSVLGNNPFLAILAGAGVTAIIQSSSASVGILQTLAIVGLVRWDSAIYIILGQNIGTCITAILSSMGASKNAKRAAAMHFLFNFIGSSIFAVVGIVTFKFAIPEIGALPIEVTQISVVHTIFNVINTVMLFPFGGLLVKIAERIIPDNGSEADASELQHLDERILETPSFAVENAVKEVIRMGRIAMKNTETSIEALFTRDEAKIEEVLNTEKTINKLQHDINHYLVKLSNLHVSAGEHATITKLFHMVSDIERVGDHAENIAELAQSLINEDKHLSEKAQIELKEITEAALKCLTFALQAYEKSDESLAKEALKLEDTVDAMEIKLRSKHMKRLASNTCDAVAGVIFLDVVSNVERISDHACNIAGVIFDEEKILELGALA